MNETQKAEFEQKLRDNKIWWCPLPWTHIFSSLSGRYAPCYDALAKTGHNMEDTTIREWYTSDYQNRLREEMLKEDKNKALEESMLIKKGFKVNPTFESPPYN